MLIKDIAQAFLASYQGRDGSIVSRVHFWTAEIGHVALIDLTDTQIENGLIKLVKRGSLHRKVGVKFVPLTPSTLNRYRAALGSVIKFAKKNKRFMGLPKGWVSPLIEVAQETEAAGRLIFLTSEEVERLIAASRIAPWKKLPVLLMMAFTTGLRRGALQGLRWRDINWEDGTVTVARTKSGKPHVAVLTAQVLTELQRLDGSNEDALIFCGKHEQKPHDYRASYEVALKRAGLPRIVFHGLRHSCASHLARNGANLLQVADTLCHSSLNTTRRYSHLMVSDRAAMINKHFAEVGTGL